MKSFLVKPLYFSYIGPFELLKVTPIYTHGLFGLLSCTIRAEHGMHCIPCSAIASIVTFVLQSRGCHNHTTHQHNAHKQPVVERKLEFPYKIILLHLEYVARYCNEIHTVWFTADLMVNRSFLFPRRPTIVSVAT